MIKIDADPSQRKYAQPKVRLISKRCDWLQAFPFQQFHVLFNSLFKVLFIFPSRYLFAIGFSPIFSFRWDLPPNLGCIPKQPDSLKVYHKRQQLWQNTGLSPSMSPCSNGLFRQACQENTSTVYNPVWLNQTGSNFELFPVHSPLLGKSLLFSFPPLIDMLKFSG